MENYNTFAETEALLQTTNKLPGRSIKEIAAATGIKPKIFYKWKSIGKARSSPQKQTSFFLTSSKMSLSVLNRPIC